jgi:hypothetical protein
LNTALRYLTTATMASQRAQRAFLQHRKAKQAGLLLPERPLALPANENRTNDLPAPPEPAPSNSAILGAAVAPGSRMHARIRAVAATMPMPPPADGPARDSYRLSTQTSTVPGLGFG